MIDIHNQLNTPPQGSSPVRAEDATTSVGAVALLTGSLAFWLAGRGDFANWALLAVVLLGGIPLV